MQCRLVLDEFIQRSTKTLIKGSRLETIEEVRKEYKQLQEQGWKKTSRFIYLFLI